jgi:tetratricopeptide (TPR) repeat protein
MGVISYYRGDYDKARGSLEQAVRLRQEIGDEAGEIWSLMYLCMINFMQGNYASAIEYNQNALQVSERRQDWFQIGIHKTNAGRISLRLGKYEEALEQLQASLEKKTRVGDRVGQGFALAAMGLACLYLDRIEEAKAYLDRSLELRQLIKDKRGTGTSLYGLGLVSLKRSEFGRAEKYFSDALQIHQELGLKPEITADLSFLGQARLLMQHPEEAIEASNQAISLVSEGVNVEEVQQVCLNHYKVLAACNEPGADVYLRQAHEIVLNQANQISDGALRKIFLENVRSNQEIHKLVEQA